MISEKIHTLGCDISDSRTKEILNRISRLESLAFPMVCLPDLHVKERTEGPSSFAAATEDSIVPELTAPSVGCGMGLVATSLNTKDVDHDFFENFYEAMKGHLGPRYGHFKNLLLWLGIIKRPKYKYDLEMGEFENIIKRGALSAIEKYDLPSETIQHIEYGGSMFTPEEKKSLSIKSILPRVSYRAGRHDLGYGFKGNHFLEIQYVEDVLDENRAKQWGLSKNQICIMYHGGGGAVSYHIGRYFGNRKKNTFKQKIILTGLKILFHFGSPKEWKYARERFHYYFFPKPFAEIPLKSEEGKRLFLATQASLNYSYAFRMAIVRRIIDSLNAVFPKKKPSAHLVWDSTHNAVVKENVQGKSVVMHRHTANRVFPGKPVFISGFNTTNSYLGVGLEGAEKHLFASDHGAGITIQNMQSQKHPKNFVTHIYQTKSPKKRVIEHITNEGLDYVTSLLEREGIIAPVARMRPLAVFKG